jgi:cardiolipin synthase
MSLPDTPPRGASQATTDVTTDVRLLCGGADFFPALIEAIDAATHTLWLETYIFDFTDAGEAVAHALMRAAARGVAVHVVVDGVGTGALPPAWAQRLAQVGVQCRVFSPLNFWSVFGFWQPSRWRRLHRKLCVVDGRVAFCGGINLIDDHIDLQGHARLSAPRLDYAVRIQGGSLVEAIQDTMRQLWSRMDVVQELRERDVRGALDAFRRRHSMTLPSGGHARLLLRDNVRFRTSIERTYRRAIQAARQDIVIACAYFFPGRSLRRALEQAALRGVRVRLLLQGHYEYFVPYRAARKLYGQLLRAGVEIHEYQASFLHAKVAVIDGYWATVGSSNLDPLSLLLAREANVVVRDAGFAQALAAHVSQAIAQGATPVDPQRYASRPWWQRFVDTCASGVLRLGVFLTGMRY